MNQSLLGKFTIGNWARILVIFFSLSFEQPCYGLFQSLFREGWGTRCSSCRPGRFSGEGGKRPLSPTPSITLLTLCLYIPACTDCFCCTILILLYCTLLILVLLLFTELEIKDICKPPNDTEFHKHGFVQYWFSAF